ncbi:MAG: hypothetical protein IPM21_08050 [Acidobacteria bacterium]|nr:hypothetical protein [Acidobacteriota bacterium]
MHDTTATTFLDFPKLYSRTQTVLSRELYNESGFCVAVTHSETFNQLRSLYSKIVALENAIPEEDFDPRPSRFALNRYYRWVVPAYFLIGKSTVIPGVAPDGLGGLKFEWRKSFECEVRLFLSGSNNRPPYLYYNFDGKDGVNYRLDSQLLARELRKLNF